MGKNSRAVSQIASSDPHLSGLFKKARQLRELEARLRRTLPPGLAAHVRVADLKDARLVLGAPTPAVANRLRYAKHDIVRALADDCSPTVREVRVRVVRG